MGKERSMTSVITMMQVLLFSMAAAVITVMAVGLAVQNHLQVRFMDRLEVSDRILEDLYVMEQDFREFGHEWGEESYSVYKEQGYRSDNYFVATNFMACTQTALFCFHTLSNSLSGKGHATLPTSMVTPATGLSLDCIQSL